MISVARELRLPNGNARSREYLRVNESLTKTKSVGIELLFSVIALLAYSFVGAQEIKVSGKFHSDSIKIGMPIAYSLSARYPENMNLLFPDSSFSFSPFEFQKKTFVPTKTENGISRDSVTYILETFEVDSIQVLKLPVFVLNPTDCTWVFSNVDSVFFQHLVKQIPDSLAAEKLPLKTNTSYLGVPWQMNYILAGIIGGVLIIVLIAVWVFFGKRIRKYFRLKRMAKNYEAFLSRFDNSVQSMETTFSPQHAETTLVLWKNYLELLLAKPFTKYTSKEIRRIENSEELGNALSEIDRMIYGHHRQNIRAPFVNLKEYVRQQFEKKKEEVVHG